MPDVYRFRSIKRLLESKELEELEIYFASSDELNDPSEGIRNLVWEGDYIVWLNLFKDYVCYTLHEYFRCFDPTYSGKPREDPIYEKVWDKVRRRAKLTSLAKVVACRTWDAWELACLLYSEVHHHAIVDINSMFAEPAHLKDLLNQIPSPTKEYYTQRNHMFEDLSNRPSESYSKINRLVLGRALSDRIELGVVDKSKQPVAQHWISELPFTYVKSRPNDFFPRWYTACFTKTCQNPAVWAYYGDEHKGACLVFDVPLEVSASNKIMTRSDRCPKCHKTPQHQSQVISIEDFYDVNYSNEHGELNFFSNALAFVWSRQHLNFWYTLPNGANSALYPEDIEGSDWRNDAFLQSSLVHMSTTKHSTWQHEQEQRLLLLVGGDQYLCSCERTFIYDFSVLKGIIFGCKTSLADQISIFKVIQQLCEKHGRNKFEFWQAAPLSDGQNLSIVSLNVPLSLEFASQNIIHH